MITSIYLFNQTAHHLLTSIEVGDHSIPQRTNSTYIFVGLFVHQLRLFPNGDHLICTAIQGHNRRLIHHNFPVCDDDGIGCPQVHRYFLCKRE